MFHKLKDVVKKIIRRILLLNKIDAKAVVKRKIEKNQIWELFFGTSLFWVFLLNAATSPFAWTFKIGLYLWLIRLIILAGIMLKNIRQEIFYYRALGVWIFTLFICTKVFEVFLWQNGILVSNIWFNFVEGWEFFAFVCYYSRYLLIRYIKHWITYSLLFIFTPALAYLLWSGIGSFLSYILGSNALLSNGATGWMVMVLTILMLNLAIVYSPEDRLTEAKVGTYLILALFSSLSYCFFVSSYIAQSLSQTEMFSSIPIRDIQTFIEDIIRWASLPYLIGSAIGSFSIELKERNIKIRHKNIEIGYEKILNELKQNQIETAVTSSTTTVEDINRT